MTMMETPCTTPPTTAELDDDGFDLDIRIAVAKDAALPEAGFSCSWYTCSKCCTHTSNPDRCC
ncbi:hypothetical protein GCM10009853_030580 [Glycomyces scopariae]